MPFETGKERKGREGEGERERKRKREREREREMRGLLMKTKCIRKYLNKIYFLRDSEIHNCQVIVFEREMLSDCTWRETQMQGRGPEQNC